MSSSDSESFTSHSGSIENQLNGALENGNVARDSATADNALRGAVESGAGFEAESPDVESLSDELEDRRDGDRGGRPGAAAAATAAATDGPRRRQSDENPDDGVAPSLSNSRAATDSWAINSPYVVESARPFEGGGGRELDLRSLSRQLCKKSARRGYDFKLMLVGESGIGKTTLIDSLFNVESTRNLGSQYVGSQREATNSTTKLCERFFELEEGGVSVRLTVIDTPGFATELDSSSCVQPVLSYVERQLDEYYRLEQGTDRSKLQDGRVHALLYMINPNSRGLKQVDLMCLKALHNKVNTVPVIGKADSLTPSEKDNLKACVLRDLTRHGISVYALPDFDDCFGHSEQTGDDFYLRNQWESLRSSMPLAVVGSNLQVQSASGQWTRAREYPWGVVDIDNPEYSDFLKLRELLIMYMEDFKDKTHEVIYEQIRLSRLRQTDWQMSRMSKTLDDRDRLLREKEAELNRLRVAVEGLQQQRASTSNSKSSSLPTAAAAAAAGAAAAAASQFEQQQQQQQTGARARAAAASASGRSATAGVSNGIGGASGQHGRGRSRYSQHD